MGLILEEATVLIVQHGVSVERKYICCSQDAVSRQPCKNKLVVFWAATRPLIASVASKVTVQTSRRIFLVTLVLK